jgi:hypothetical protein
MMNSLAEYPHWFVVACATLAAAVLLWLVVKLVEATLWILCFGVILVAIGTAAWLLLK